MLAATPGPLGPRGEKRRSVLPPPSLGGGQGVVEDYMRDALIHNSLDVKSLRKTLCNEATPAERELWNVLRQSNLGGYKFRRQHSVGRYIVDFYCPLERLAIELDGDSHFTDEAIEYDRERTAFLNCLNIRVLRFLNTDVHENLDVVSERILEELQATTPGPS